MSLTSVHENFMGSIFKSSINESKFSDIMRYMVGDKKPVKGGIGIMTGWNPQGAGIKKKGLYTQDDKAANNLRDKRLKEFIASNRDEKGWIFYDDNEGQYGFKDDEGEYHGGFERGIVIVNIEIDDLLDLAKRFDQQAVIFGTPEKDGTMTFAWLTSDGDLTQFRYKARMSGKYVAKLKDLYSAIGARKYVIPFFSRLRLDLDKDMRTPKTQRIRHGMDEIPMSDREKAQGYEA